MVKQIDLNEMYAFMKDTIIRPMLRADFLRLANERFDCTSKDSGYFSNLILSRTEDFTRYMAMLTPTSMLKEAKALNFKILNVNGAMKAIKERSKTMHWKIIKEHKQNPDMPIEKLSAQLGISYTTVYTHLFNRCNCRKRKFWKKYNS